MKSMRICLIGEYSGDLEEGMRKTSFYLSEELSKHHQVLPLNIKKIFFRSFWKEIRAFKPQIIHYVHGPSLKSLMILKGLAFYCKGVNAKEETKVKTVVSATHPAPFRLSKKIFSLFKPDLVLTQSEESERLFKGLGCKTEFLPGGVDLKRFVPVSDGVKEALRAKYGVEKEKVENGKEKGDFVILHVGSIKEGRGIEIFKEIARRKEGQVLIIGSRSTGIEKRLYRSLKESGCKIWVKYFKNVEEVYALSDCYVFPTPPENKINAIEMPLSVLEAMSCNLPVLTTKFGALPRVFVEGEGLVFAEGEGDFVKGVKEIENGAEIKTREKVLPYSWENVVKRLEVIYEKLVKEKEKGKG